MNIRRAKAQDAKVLAKLVFDSAPGLLTAAFNVEPHFSVKSFLAESLSNPYGQYGYQNHWVVELDSQVVASVSAWHSNMGDDFHRATLTAMTHFYGFENALSLLHVNQALQDCIPSIKEEEWCIGHLSVMIQNQRLGVASALMNFMTQQALDNKKSIISLDVEASNVQAISFYRHLGFSIASETQVTTKMAQLDIKTHFHLNKALSF